jgi:hypothetical protein
VAGLSQLGSGKSAGQIGLETAAAILGGIGMGAAGRRIGARIGRSVHSQPLENQGGALAMIGRTFGNETTAQGLKENAIMGREALKQSILRETSSQMVREAAADPVGFAKRYGIEAEDFKRRVDMVGAGNSVSTALKTIESMKPEQREALLKQVMGNYEEVERAIAEAAHSKFDEQVADLVQNRERAGRAVEEVFKVRGLGDMVSRSLEGLDRPVQQVTGEQVGKAVGRFLGDEVGIIGGLYGGSLLAQQMGIESPKDARIRELERQLPGAG